MAEGPHPPSLNLPPDLKQEQRRIFRNSSAGLLFCVLVLVGAYWLLPLYFRLPGDDIDGLITF